MIIDFKKLSFFYILVSSLYVFTPIFGYLFFDSNPSNLLEFTFIGILLIIVVLPFFTLQTIQNIKFENMKPYRILLFSTIILITIIFVLISVYGGYQEAFLRSYTSRTGVDTPTYFNALLLCAPVITNILLLNIYLNKRLDFLFKSIFFLIACLYLLIFLLSGNRNLILFSISISLGIYISHSTYKKILFVFLLMVFVAFLMAAFRNYGILNIDELKFPPLNYWNPMVHEFGTSYNVFNMIINNNIRIDGFEFPLVTYIQGLINLLPGFLKPTGFESFSTVISSQLGENGEGFGNSPIAEVIYNGYFPAILFQILPLLFVIFLFKVKHKYSYFFKIIAFGLFSISIFNFWRIGFAELLKIQMSFFILSLIFFLLVSKDKRNVC